jgi:hypothetical protein
MNFALREFSEVEERSRMPTIKWKGRLIQRPDIYTPTDTYWGECVNGMWCFGLTETGEEAARRLRMKKQESERTS